MRTEKNALTLAGGAGVQERTQDLAETVERARQIAAGAAVRAPELDKVRQLLAEHRRLTPVP